LSLELVREDPRIMLCYAWDGQPLRQKHGFPLRVYIPNLYGMKQPKWITRITAVEDWEPGYWVVRGWSATAEVRTTSVIDTIAIDSVYEADGQQYVPMGGIAYSGARGISKVEVRVDDGEWQEARLRTPLSETTWVIWRYDWPFEEGRHTFTVRTFEADGTPQIADINPRRPDGATGLHSVETRV
ncbi:MAG: molybdopterin-binding oxidoreductase, partial [Chloroflexi bacterium]